MENTDEVLTLDPTPKWYLAVGESSVGPLKTSEVIDRIKAGETSWVDFVWKSGEKNWTRISSQAEFKVRLPGAPSHLLIAEIEESLKPKVKKAEGRKVPPPPPVQEEEAAWFLYTDGASSGPYTEAEVDRMLSVGKITPKTNVWKEDMAGWEPLEKQEQFKKSKLPPPPVPTVMTLSAPKKVAVSVEPQNNRNSPRKPLVARILLSDDQTIISGICRDISVGGMQVLTDKLPGPVGSTVKLNVSPGDKSQKITSFVAEGVIVRLLEDRRGFSLRFNKIPQTIRDAIEKYISENE